LLTNWLPFRGPFKEVRNSLTNWLPFRGPLNIDHRRIDA